MFKCLAQSLRRFALVLAGLIMLASTGRSALLQIVVDNDFAVLTGTTNSVLRLVYQNYDEWPQQVAAASSFNLTLNPGETTIYILGMGGGGQENISGKINNININTLSLTMSSNLRDYLTGYNDFAVANASYTAQLSDVQTALPNLTFSTATANDFGDVPSITGYAPGYGFAPSTAVLLKIAASDLNLGAVPEPGTWAAAALLVGAAGYVRWRKRAKVS